MAKGFKATCECCKKEYQTNTQSAIKFISIMESIGWFYALDLFFCSYECKEKFLGK
jgi:hypothetical protein